MFGSGIVAKHVYYTLRERPAITAALGNPPRLKNIGVAPPLKPGEVGFPMALHYAESGTYSGPFTAEQEPIEETVSYLVRFICQGESDAPIRAAAKDALTALSVEFATGEVVQDSETFSVTLLPSGEWPITTTVENGIIYRMLGFYLTATVFRVA